ncbi:hypothetical protein BKA70DRAFT_460859 [Coprinopsis sp. MPI-PUGE-AT-0042]|nr:hypothetical protein BKA70DRAFT_460859 [Coprinopsis sp. MPI-PUGE-AT-0042]
MPKAAFSALPQNDQDDLGRNHHPHPTQHYPPTYHASGSTSQLHPGPGPAYVPSPIQGVNPITSYNGYDPSKSVNTTNEHVLRPPKPNAADNMGGPPRPSFHHPRERTESVHSRMSLYEFHQPKRQAINAERVSKFDWPILLLCIAIFAGSILFFVFGGTVLLRRPDIRKTVFTKAVIGAAALSLPLTLIVAAIVVERKFHEFKQHRKHVKISTSSWTKIPILTFSTILTFLITIMWGVGAIGFMVKQMDYEPHSHRHLRQRTHWVGGDRHWEKGEKLGGAIFTNEGGILQIPVIISLAAFACSILLTILSEIQLTVGKPKA